MANKKQMQKKQNTRDSKSGGTQSKNQSQKPKQPTKGAPSRKSGMLSMGMAVFGVVWTIAIYMQRGPGVVPLLGIIFVVFCLMHATYNFQGVKRQAAIDRGEIPAKPEKGEKKQAVAAEAPKEVSKKAPLYAVYRVKKKPNLVIKKK